MSSSREKSRSLITPALVLFLLAPTIGELISSSMPPKEFFSPFFLIVAILYGGGAIIVRELTIRWRKGWATLLVLAIAYGILEEGLLCKSFFDPNWPDLGDLGLYGRWMGVNWLWAVQLTVYHAAVSIATSILLTTFIFYDKRNESWIDTRGLKWLAVLLLLDTLLGAAALGGIPNQPYRPPVIPYLLAVASVVGLYYYARSLPVRIAPGIDKRVRRPLLFWVIGAVYFPSFYIIPSILKNLGTPPLLTIIVFIVYTALLVKLIMHLSGNGAAWSNMHQFALAAGGLSMFIFADFFWEFNAERPDDTTGMTLVAIGAVLFLIWMWRRVKRLEEAEKSNDCIAGKQAEIALYIEV